MSLNVQSQSSACQWAVQYVGCNGQPHTKYFDSPEAAQANVAQFGTGCVVPPVVNQGPCVPAPGPCTPPTEIWSVEYQGCDGKKHTKLFPTQQAAEANIAQHHTGNLSCGSSYAPTPCSNKYC